MKRLIYIATLVSVFAVVMALLSGCNRSPETPAPSMKLYLFNSYPVEFKDETVTLTANAMLRIRAEFQSNELIDSIVGTIKQGELPITYLQSMPILTGFKVENGKSSIEYNSPTSIDISLGDAVITLKLYEKGGRTISRRFTVLARPSLYTIELVNDIRFSAQDAQLPPMPPPGGAGSFYDWQLRRLGGRQQFIQNPAGFDFAYGVLNVGLRSFISPSVYGVNTAPIVLNPAATNAKVTLFGRTNLDFATATAEQIMAEPEPELTIFPSVNFNNRTILFQFQTGARGLIYLDRIEDATGTDAPINKGAIFADIKFARPR